MQSSSKHQTTSVNLKHSIINVLYLHAQAMVSSLGRLSRGRFNFFMTILVMAIALTLASGFYLLILNLNQFTGNIEASNQISVFLKTETAKPKITKMLAKFKSDEQFDQVLFISKQQALSDFKAYSGFIDVINALEENPLPDVIQLQVKNSLEDSQLTESIISELESMSEVAQVQADITWLKRLQSIMAIIERGVMLLSFLLAVAIIFITGNTIRLELQNRKDEVLIAKLVGATNGFIQRPFIYTGFWLGFISALCALVITAVMLWFIQQPVNDLSELYQTNINLQYFGFSEAMVLLALSTLLSIVGAWIVSYNQLQQIKPD